MVRYIRRGDLLRLVNDLLQPYRCIYWKFCIYHDDERRVYYLFYFPEPGHQYFHFD